MEKLISFSVNTLANSVAGAYLIPRLGPRYDAKDGATSVAVTQFALAAITVIATSQRIFSPLFQSSFSSLPSRAIMGKMIKWLLITQIVVVIQEWSKPLWVAFKNKERPKLPADQRVNNALMNGKIGDVWVEGGALAPIFEELIFRGFCTNIIDQINFLIFGRVHQIKGVSAASLLSSIAFLSIHKWQDSFASLSTLVFSWQVSWLNQQAGSLWPGITFHILHNSLGIAKYVAVAYFNKWI